MRSVNPQPGEYKIANALDGGKGGMRRETVQGLILCDGIFGLREETGTWTLTHLGTGRRTGRYPTRRKAYKVAVQLAALDLPWDAKSNKEWEERRDMEESERAVEIIRRLGRL